MINLFILVCSLFLQFGAYSVPVTVEPTIIDDAIIEMGFQDMLNKGGIFSYYGDVKTSNGGVIISAVPSGDYIEVHYALANHNFNTSVVSTFSVGSYQLANEGIYGNFDYTNFTGYVYYYYPDSPSSSFGGGGGFSNTFSYPVSMFGNGNILQYISSAIEDNKGNEILVPPEVVTLPTFPIIGSLDISGHSSHGSPLDALGGLSWASMTGHSSGGAVAPSPHSSSTHYNITIQAPSSDDFKTDNLLYMLGNKLADITENTSAITSALGGVIYNITQGASAVFNGISALNDNIVNFVTYLTSIPTLEDITNALDECENIGALRDLSESINIWNDLGLTQVNSAPSYTFNFNGTMFESMGNFTLNFNFLDSIKNLWQPLFIALLYFNLLITILTGLPDLIQGRGAT